MYCYKYLFIIIKIMIVGILLFLLYGVTYLSYGLEFYYEFVSLYFFTILLYNFVFYIMNTFIYSFNNINPSHKKMYVIKNYLKSFYLASLCFTLPYFIIGNYDILFIKRLSIYYTINDIVGLTIVSSLPLTTILHHITTTICCLLIQLKHDDSIDILTLVVLYGMFSSFTFSVNFYLGNRIYNKNILSKYYLSLTANIVYVISCIINWLLQIYLFISMINYSLNSFCIHFAGFHKQCYSHSISEDY